jgi:hypothetical protein
MGNYVLHNHNSSGTSGAAKKLAEEVVKGDGSKVPMVLHKTGADEQSAEFVGYKDTKFDYQPMTVTHMVVGGKTIKLPDPIKVEFIQAREGENPIIGTLKNIVHAPENPNAGKPNDESVKALDKIYEATQAAKAAAPAPTQSKEGVSLDSAVKAPVKSGSLER